MGNWMNAWFQCQINAEEPLDVFAVSSSGGIGTNARWSICLPFSSVWCMATACQKGRKCNEITDYRFFKFGLKIRKFVLSG